MIRFNPDAPFPLLAAESHSYAEAQIHSAKVDSWLGMRTEAVELALNGPGPAGKVVDQETAIQQLWIGLPTRTLLTPYTEIRLILDQLAPPAGSTVVDLGAGYGRMGFVVGWHYPEVRFIGYELVDERVTEARRCLEEFAFPRVRMECADLNEASFRPESAEFYFLYDFGSRQAIDKTLDDLREIARSRAITVVGRGRASRDAIERRNPWLSEVVAPEHYPHYSIYRTA